MALPHWWVLRAFPPTTLRAIETAIAASESRHDGELRFVVEANLPIHGLLRGQSPRTRAIELFSQLRVWDTEHNSGVLIYVQLIDRRVEIVADRGIDAKVGHEFWHAVCRHMEATFRQGQFETGALQALAEITRVLVEHFPARGAGTNQPNNPDNPNELPDSPLVL